MFVVHKIRVQISIITLKWINSLIGKVFTCRVKGCLFKSNLIRKAFNLMVKCKIDNFDI